MPAPPSLGSRACFCGGGLVPGVHPLYGTCRECGTQVLWASLSADELKAFYGIDAYWRGHVVQVSGYPSIDERARSDASERVPYWMSLISALGRPPESLLEIGCAHGGFLALARERGVALVAGVEVDEATCAFARETFGLPHVCAGLFPDVELPLDRFEMVCGFDVIEHFADPVAALARVAKLLEPAGTFIFQTPWYRGQGADWENFRPEEHLYLFTKHGLERLFEMAGLRLDFLAPGLFPQDAFVVGGVGPGPASGGLALVRADAIGDAVLFSGALEHIRQRFPDMPLTVVCQDHLVPLYDHCPHVDDAIGYNRRYIKTSKPYQRYLTAALRRRGFEVTVNTAYSRDNVADMLALNTGAGVRLALAGDLANTTAEQRAEVDSRYTAVIDSPGDWKPEIERAADLLAGLGLPPLGPLRPKIWLGQADRDFADRFLGERGLGENVMALFCGAQYPVRFYTHYGAALARLAREQGLAVIALGTAADRGITGRNLADIAGSEGGVTVHDLCGATSLGQAAAILARCRIAAGAETGLAHLAGALGVPNAALLGGGHFGRFMPWPSPLAGSACLACLPLSCYACNWRCRYDHVWCVASLQPMVFEAACRAALAGPEPSGKARVFMQSQDFWPSRPSLPSWSADLAASLLGDAELIEVSAPPSRDPMASELAARAVELDGAGRTDAALAFHLKALAKAPDDHALMRDAGVALIRQGRPAEALALLSQAFQAYPHDPHTAASLAAMLRQTGQPDLAGEVEAVLADLHPEYQE